jgi:hypothetical protein
MSAKASARLEKLKADAEWAELLRTIGDTSWLPAGFTKFALNPYLAYKKNSQSCSYGSCLTFDLVSSKYCSSIYIAGNLMKNNVVYDFSNDSARGINPGEIVRMKLQYTHEVSGTSIHFTDATCR